MHVLKNFQRKMSLQLQHVMIGRRIFVLGIIFSEYVRLTTSGRNITSTWKFDGLGSLEIVKYLDWEAYQKYSLDITSTVELSIEDAFLGKSVEVTVEKLVS